MNSRNFFAELKRRNVYRVAVAYAVVAWLLIQIATSTFPVLEIPVWAIKLVIALVVLGFPIALVLAWAFELTPEGIKRTEDVAPEESVTQKTGRKLTVALAALAAVALGLLLYQTLRPRSHASGESAAAADKSIAVLPFDNFNRDPENAYFADGIQDEILTRLAKIDELKVISRTSTQRYKSSPENLPEIAKQLGVAHVLEGSVQKAGDQIRVTVQLIRAATDAHVWAETYDRKLTDIFAVQSDIAENIAKSLRAKLTPKEQQAVAAKPTENADAYESYLRGLALWNKLTTSPEDLENTVVHFARAVKLDPQFAVAWASLATAQVYNFAEFDRTPRRLAQAKQALDTALRLQPESADTQFALGMYRYRGLADYDSALIAFQKSRAQSGNDVPAIEFSAYVKRRQGKWDEALALHAESLALDPRNPIILSEAAVTYRSLRRFNDARALVLRALEIEPSSALLLIQLADLHQAEGDLATAGQLLHRVPLDGKDPLHLAARVRHWMLARQFADAIQALRHVLDGPEQLPKPFLASYRGLLGMVEKLGGNIAAAQVELAQAREELMALRAQGDTGSRTASDLILVSAMLGDRETVEREAAQLQNEIASDHVNGPQLEGTIAAARAQLGEIDVAIASVKQLLAKPGENSLTPALLRLDPLVDPLRSDPRFQELAGAKP